MLNRLVIIGNGFDLAHGLKTSYKDFLNWYMCNAFKTFCEIGSFEDKLLSIENKYTGQQTNYNVVPNDFTHTIKLIQVNNNQSLTYRSKFYEGLIDVCDKGWVDIEYQYFLTLKRLFAITNIADSDKLKNVTNLNEEFGYIINLLTEYIEHINIQIKACKKLPINNPRLNFLKAFEYKENSPVTFINFNYTDTLSELGYANEQEIIHIHGRVSNKEQNPIIFGYGDETDPIYQELENSGENNYLEHIKSFSYYRTKNYQRLMELIDSEKYEVYIFGHSCGLSDRVLLSEIFEHQNCWSIETFYHQRNDSSDNFKEITQAISRHFKPNNKKLMRRRIKPKDEKCLIPKQQ